MGKAPSIYDIGKHKVAKAASTWTGKSGKSESGKTTASSRSGNSYRRKRKVGHREVATNQPRLLDPLMNRTVEPSFSGWFGDLIAERYNAKHPPKSWPDSVSEFGATLSTGYSKTTPARSLARSAAKSVYSSTMTAGSTVYSKAGSAYTGISGVLSYIPSLLLSTLTGINKCYNALTTGDPNGNRSDLSYDDDPWDGMRTEYNRDDINSWLEGTEMEGWRFGETIESQERIFVAVSADEAIPLEEWQAMEASKGSSPSESHPPPHSVEPRHEQCEGNSWYESSDEGHYHSSNNPRTSAPISTTPSRSREEHFYQDLYKGGGLYSDEPRYSILGYSNNGATADTGASRHDSFRDFRDTKSAAYSGTSTGRSTRVGGPTGW